MKIGVLAGLGGRNAYLPNILDQGSMRGIGVGTPFGELFAFHGTIAGVEAVGIPAFGCGDNLGSHETNFAAQAFAMKKLGVDVCVTYNGFGGLKEEYGVGCVVVPSDIIDLVHAEPASIIPVGLGSWIRVDVGSAVGGPFCSVKRQAMVLAAEHAAQEEGRKFFDKATMVVVPGPRLETRAEIDNYHTKIGDIIGTNMVPRAWYLRELGVCYVSLATVTDFAGRVKTREWANLPAEFVGTIIRNFVNLLPDYQDSCRCREEWEKETLPKMRKSDWGKLILGE